MTDPLDDLNRGFKAATPAPDAAKKQANLARAEEIFVRAQGSADGARPTPDRPEKAGVLKGVASMLAKLTTRPALTASTALVAVGLVAFMPVLMDTGRQLPDTYIQSEPVIVNESTEITQPSEPKALREESGAVDDVIMAEPMLEAEVMVEEAPVIMPAPMRVRPPAPGNDARLQSAPVAGLADMDGAVGHIAPEPDVIIIQEPDTEEFANEAPSAVKIVSEEPVSTFSIDVDTASYSVVRSSLMNGYLPDAQAVRIEEMVNYFPYDYAAPAPGEGPFKPTVTVTPTPWNPDTQLMQIALQGQMPALDDRPPLNLVFLIDTSGSMDQPDKLPLLKQSFRLMLGQLSPQDQVSIVTYAGSAGRVLDATPASERAAILGALERLDVGGSTAGQEGLQLAYATAEAMAEEGEVTRVILATDGDFNVGIHDPEELKDFIADKRDGGTYLSVLGFGRGNLDDATMQALAQNGNGQAAYIDTLSEAQKVLVDQLTGALFPIANDVKIQVEFNPAEIAEYRLIGYETRALRREDFNNDKIDAGEIGAGHSVTAIYELTPVGSPAVLNDPLRYASETPAEGGSGELGFLRLRYKAPGEDDSVLIETPVVSDMGAFGEDARFAAAIAGFGQLLRSDAYLGDWGWAEAIALAEGAVGEDRFGYRREAVTLMRLAESLSQ